MIAREPGGFASEARPCLVVQAAETFPSDTTVTLCPITTEIRNAPLIRIPIGPGHGTGLRDASEVEVDLISTYRVDSVDRIVGAASRITMQQVDAALRRWLSL